MLGIGGEVRINADAYASGYVDQMLVHQDLWRELHDQVGGALLDIGDAGDIRHDDDKLVATNASDHV